MASKRTVSVSEDSTRSNSSFSMESSKKRDGDLGNLANPARLKLIQDNVTQLESMTQGQLLAEMILADDVSTRNASHRTLATASRLVRETAQLMTALFPDNRDASPADMPAELRTRLTAVEEAIQDLSKRAESLLAVETRDVNRIPRLSRSQTESLTSVLHFHRERFWRKLFEFPVVALKHFEVLREVAAGKGTPSDHIFEASFRGGGEALLRLHAQRILTEIALLQ